MYDNDDLMSKNRVENRPFLNLDESYDVYIYIIV